MAATIMTLLIFLSVHLTSISAERSFKIDKEAGCFRKDGKCFQIISGSIHYYRVPPYYWADRLKKLKAAGFNTVQSYIPWNYHQLSKGTVDWTGNKDLWSFLQLCNDLGLMVLLRPGPFIASEYEFGGFPSWLPTLSSTISFRSSEKEYYGAVAEWFDYLLPKLRPYFYNLSSRGPVIAIQVENEYGSNPLCDKTYFNNLADMVQSTYKGSVMVYSVNGPGTRMLECGTSSEIYNTVDFGSGNNASKAFAQQARYNFGGKFPSMNTEFYPGWLSHWGSHFPNVPGTKVADALDKILSLGASVNMYMFHGGTNFGPQQGASSYCTYGIPPILREGWITIAYTACSAFLGFYNRYKYNNVRFSSGAKGNADGSVFVPHTTSYDYNAPVSEAGDLTEKYWQIRDVIRKYGNVSTPPNNTTKKARGSIPLHPVYTLLDDDFLHFCGNIAMHSYPLSFEEINQINGIVVYTTEVHSPGVIILPKIRDRSYVYQNAKRLATVKGSAESTSLRVNAGRLDIIVISDGHINTGHVHLNDPRLYMKGIIRNVTQNGKPVTNWNMTKINSSMPCVPLTRETPVKRFQEERFRLAHENPQLHYIPTVYQGVLSGDTGVYDTFLDTTGWGKGIAYVGEYNLGRYWPLAGPQLTLFTPHPYLPKLQDSSRVIMLEFEKPSARLSVSFVSSANLRGPIDKSQL